MGKVQLECLLLNCNLQQTKADTRVCDRDKFTFTCLMIANCLRSWAHGMLGKEAKDWKSDVG